MITLVLRHRFIYAPPLLSAAIKPFHGLEYTFHFNNLICDYLPSERERLLAMPPDDAAARFVKLFSDLYFPIEFRSYWGESPLQHLTRSIPLEWHGMPSWNYDSGQMSPGQLLAAALCVCPLQNQAGAHIAVMDRFSRIVNDTAKLIPEGGYPLERVEEALHDSPWPGLLIWCRWLFARTGNRWLDAASGLAEWTRENVDALARDWPLYLEAQKQMDGFNKWLKADLKARAAEVINYVKTKAGKPLIEIFGGEHAE